VFVGEQVRQGLLHRPGVLRLTQAKPVLRTGHQRLRRYKGQDRTVLRSSERRAVLLQRNQSRLLQPQPDMQGRDMHLQERQATLRQEVLREGRGLLERRVLPEGQGELRRWNVLRAEGLLREGVL
jgi:hypothetical protein